MKPPLVSVILTVYNGENYLAQSIDSVIGQTYKNLEIIIIDDGSTDKTAVLANTYLKDTRVQYVFQKNGGHATALNKGVSVANGEFLAFIDHDDIWHLSKLDIQLSAFDKDPDLDVAFSYQKSFAENAYAESLIFEREPVPGYMPGSMLIKATSFFKVGSFDTEIKKGYFFPWFGLLKLKHLKKILLPDLLYHRRVHGENLSICSRDEDYKDYFLAIRALRKQSDK